MGTTRIRNECVQTDNSVSVRPGGPATRARDRLLAGGDPSSEGAAWRKANEIHRRTKMSIGTQGQKNWRKAIEGDRGNGDAPNIARLASQADREEI